MCLNPFEVREVLQDKNLTFPITGKSLNPFEVREVLQVQQHGTSNWCGVSIPLKSGRCCKFINDIRIVGEESQSL